MNAQTNKTILSTVGTKSKTLILASIAKHYGISPAEAYQEVTDTDAEHLLDYMVGTDRAATSALIQRHAL